MMFQIILNRLFSDLFRILIGLFDRTAKTLPILKILSIA